MPPSIGTAKATVTGILGAMLTIGTFVLHYGLHIDLPPEVVAAVSFLGLTATTYFTPHGG